MSSSTVRTPRPYPLLESAPAAAALALVSGLLNAWTFGQIGTFATVQSGNLLSIGYFMAEGDPSRVLAAAASVLSFALGSFLCTLVVLWRARTGRGYSVEVLLCEVIALAALALASVTGAVGPEWIAGAISFLAGVQGNAFHRETGMLYGNIAVTSVVQMAASLLARAAGRTIASDGEPHLRPAAAYTSVLVAFAAGGGIGFALDRAWSCASIVGAAAVLGILLLIARSAHGAVDPSQNAPTP